jgi:L-ascorbate metabolism protein UlaG (beta-lactamase superfamily)
MLCRSLVTLAFAFLLAPPTLAQQLQRQIPAPAPAPGKVKLEWLGHEFYRFTSPNGVVVVTSPWLGNPDGPVPKESLARTDFILVPNAHNDDMGNPEEVHLVSGAMVFAPGPLGRWLIAEKGLKQESFRRAGIGDLIEQKGLRFRFPPSHHDNTLPNGADGGPAAAFLVNFENGFTVFYNGHSTLIADLALYAQIYQPDVAILGITNSPQEFAQVAKLLSTNNPKLKQVIPSHQRPNAPVLEQGKKELEAVGLGDKWFLPELRRAYEYEGMKP